MSAEQQTRAISIHALLAESDPCIPTGHPGALHFYPRSPCGERLFNGDHGHIKGDISIHALLAESDAVVYDIVLMPREFLSTLSLRRATSHLSKFNTPKKYFYPRSPCGERHGPILTIIYLTLFLSTLSLRRATTQGFPALHHIFISIHALLAESDRLWACSVGFAF